MLVPRDDNDDQQIPEQAEHNQRGIKDDLQYFFELHDPSVGLKMG